MTEDVLLSIKDLHAGITSGGAVTRILRGLSLQVYRGARLGIVGESGSGKTMLALGLLRLLPRGINFTAGSVLYEGHDLVRLSESAMQRLRGRDIAMVFQNAAAALNPVFPVGRQIADVYRVHQGGSARSAWDQAVAMLEVVGLSDPPRQARAYPHELSGGMAQRAMIAMALIGTPRLLIADEPTTGLDVTIQAQVLSLIRDRVQRLGITLILISHDIAIIEEMCTHVAVMYAGEVVEHGSHQDVLGKPAHPYTRALLACAAANILPGERLPFIEGQVPSPHTEMQGCAFASRCPTATEQCRQERPPLREVSPGHWVMCHYV